MKYLISFFMLVMIISCNETNRSESTQEYIIEDKKYPDFKFDPSLEINIDDENYNKKNFSDKYYFAKSQYKLETLFKTIKFYPTPDQNLEFFEYLRVNTNQVYIYVTGDSIFHRPTLCKDDKSTQNTQFPYCVEMGNYEEFKNIYYHQPFYSLENLDDEEFNPDFLKEDIIHIISYQF